ncbi:MAG TPA: redoxin domain-containing protein [Caulobacterales bacterium]|nr:redoxin domain-containing protein [Caulobacterales bacterium]
MKKFIAAAVLAALIASPAYAALSVGAKAPEFSTQGSLGGKAFDFKLTEALKKGPVVIYFFPAAYTAGCTAETKAFADAADDFKAAGATLIGLTGGAKLADGTMANATENKARLAEFAAEHCRDKFPIGAASAETIKAFDVSLPARVDWSARTSYVIAPDGKILLAYSDPKPDQHIIQTLDAVKAWKAAQKK